MYVSILNVYGKLCRLDKLNVRGRSCSSCSQSLGTLLCLMYLRYTFFLDIMLIYFFTGLSEIFLRVIIKIFFMGFNVPRFFLPFLPLLLLSLILGHRCC